MIASYSFGMNFLSEPAEENNAIFVRCPLDLDLRERCHFQTRCLRQGKMILHYLLLTRVAMLGTDEAAGVAVRILVGGRDSVRSAFVTRRRHRAWCLGAFEFVGVDVLGCRTVGVHHLNGFEVVEVYLRHAPKARRRLCLVIVELSCLLTWCCLWLPRRVPRMGSVLVEGCRKSVLQV